MARFDLTEAEWRLIELLLPNKPRGASSPQCCSSQPASGLVHEATP